MLAVLSEVSKFYGQPGTEGFNPVLDQVSFMADGNETVAITGPSGSGKSTLLNILGTLDRPSSGSVLLDGVPVDSFDAVRLAQVRNRLIGFVFQRHLLLPQLTLMENVLLPALPLKEKELKVAAAGRAERLIERVGLKDHRHRRPAELSVGECQRAAVVRALVNQPRLLLADEPTGSLDAGNARQLAQLLAELNREEDLAVILVTHAPEIAAFMGTIYRLSAGKLHRTEKA